MPNLQYSNATPKKPVLKIALAILVLALTSGAGYGAWKLFNKSEPTFLSKEPITEPTTPESTIQPEPDQMTDWKVYKNEEYRFEVKYPKDWYKLDTSIAESKGILCVEFSSTPDGAWIDPTLGIWGTVTIRKERNLEGLSLEKWFEEDEWFRMRKPSYRYITVDRIRSIEVDNLMEFSGKAVFIPYNNEIYSAKIWIPERDREEQRKLERIFHQMLSTFKFLK